MIFIEKEDYSLKDRKIINIFERVKNVKKINSKKKIPNKDLANFI